MRILMIDDNPGDIRLVREILNENGIRIRLVAAASAEEALALLNHRPDPPQDLPDLILLDLGLPKMGGLQVLSELKKVHFLRPIPVVVFSSSRDEEDITQAYDRHANAYLVKPHGLDELGALVRNTIRFWSQVAVLTPSSLAGA